MKQGIRARLGVCMGLLSLLLTLGGCMQLIEETPLADVAGVVIEAGTAVPEADAFEAIDETAVLYFLSKDGAQLVPFPRTLTRENGMSCAETALRALLAGPKETETDAFWPEKGTAQLPRLIEVSGGVATVSLPARYRVLNPTTLYAVRLAVADTLMGFPEISYVNVLVGGREEGLDLGSTIPVGTISRVDELDILLRYERMLDARQSTSGFGMLTTLYYPSADGTFLLPIVRNVTYENAQPITALYTILDELGKSAGNELLARTVPAPMEELEEMPEIVRLADGTRAIEIRFGRALDEELAHAHLGRRIYLGMLTDTLMGCVPGVEGLRIYIGGELVTQLSENEKSDGRVIHFDDGLITRERIGSQIGVVGTVYVRAQQEGKLSRISCILPREAQTEPRMRLAALMENTENSALPAGFGEADIQAVRVEKEHIVVHFSRAFGQAIAKLDEQQMRLAVYAMVNTLTQEMNQHSVIFFFGGEQLMTQAVGLDLRGKMVRNPGMVVD